MPRSLHPVESRGLTQDQVAKVQSFKHLLNQTGHWDQRFDDHDAARFLKARNYDLAAAKQMWEQMLAWRRENRVDTIHEWFVFHERHEFDRLYPTGLHKTDKEGHPVLIQQLGRVNIGALYKVTTDDRIKLAHIAENEHLRRVVFPACSMRSGRHVDQLFTIIDLQGVAFTSMMRVTSLLKMYMAMDSNNYPETLAHMAIINAPGWFSTSWGAVKSVLSGETVRKIEILGKDYLPALLKRIPRENLLVEYGGSSTGCVVDNIGPWQEVKAEPEPLLPLQEPMRGPAPSPQPGPAAQHGAATSGKGDERAERDVLHRRSASPLRPGAKAVQRPQQQTPLHPAPPVSPPLAKRPHAEPLLGVQPITQPLLPQAAESSAASVDGSSDTSVGMTAPLLSNFIGNAYDAPSAKLSPLDSASTPEARDPGVNGSANTILRSGSLGAAAHVSPVQLSSPSTGMSSSFTAGLQAAAAFVGYHPHPHMAGSGSPVRTAADGAGLRSSKHSGSGAPVTWPQPTQVQLSSPPRHEPLASAQSAMHSALSPTSVETTADTATSRRREVSGGGSFASRASGGAQAPGAAPVAVSGALPGIGSGSLPSGALGSGVLGSMPTYGSEVSQAGAGSFLRGAASAALDGDDAESIRLSVMSQRSFYSAMSHIDASSSSGLTSPNETSDYARRWSLQRELHAAAIASALAATAEQRRVNGVGPAGAAVPASGSSISSRKTVTAPASAASAAASSAVPCVVPPAAQQAFGSYLDQPPPYGRVGPSQQPAAADRGERPSPSGAGQQSAHAAAESSKAHHQNGQPGPHDHAGTARHHRSNSQGDHVLLAASAHVGSDATSAGGMSRSTSAAALDECGLGVKWARGWFFRRRNYGRLVEADGHADGHASRGGGSKPTHKRSGSAGVPYSSMHDEELGLQNTTSPSKLLPKAGSGHHARGDSWEWDQPVPYSDQVLGSWRQGGSSVSAGGVQRDLSFGRSGERRRLLRTDSPGRRHSLLDDCMHCSCLPCCAVM